MASIEVFSYATPPVVIKGQEGTATQAYVIGDLVKFEAAGRFVIGTAACVYAIARKAAIGTAGTVGDYELLSLDNLYIIYAGAAVTTAQADVGGELDITFTVGAHVGLANATSGVDGVIVMLHPEDGAKLAGRYIFRFKASAISETGA